MKHYEPDSVLSLGLAWASNSVNCLPFRGNGVLSHQGTRYVGFYDPLGNLAVVGLCADEGLSRATIPNSLKPTDAHMSISLGIDASGHLHLAYGAHASPMQVVRSREPGLAEGFDQPATLQSEFATSMTYPIFLSPRPTEDLILIFRDGRAASGDIRVTRFDISSARWRDEPVALLSGRTKDGWEAGPYLNTPAIGANGEVVLFVVWRLDPNATSGGAVTNVGIDCVISRDHLRSLATLGGILLSPPVTMITAERVIAVPIGVNLINQGAAAMRRDNTPMVLTYWDDEYGIPQYKLGWREGSSWSVSVVSNFSERFRLDGAGTLPLPHSRPELLIDKAGTAHVIFRSQEWGGRLAMTSLCPPDYSLEKAHHRILIDEDLGFYEPVVDRQAWKHGELALYVQWCAQESNADQASAFAEAEARVVTWQAERFSNGKLE